jgi:hypothetical protein
VRKQATRTLQNFTDDNAIEGEDRIPRDLIADAAGLAFMTFVKIGMVFTGRIGTGTSALLSKNCIDTSRAHRLHSARLSALEAVTAHAALLADSHQCLLLLLSMLSTLSAQSTVNHCHSTHTCTANLPCDY